MPEKEKHAAIIFDAVSEIHSAGVMLKNASRQFFRNHPTTDVQFNILMLLKYADHSVTQKELSEWLLVDKSDLTGLVDRMESAGHLRRIKTAKDRRSYHLQLTEASEKLLDELECSYRELLNSVMGDFTEDELFSIIKLMNKLRRALDNRCTCLSKPAPKYKESAANEQ